MGATVRRDMIFATGKSETRTVASQVYDSVSSPFSRDAGSMWRIAGASASRDIFDGFFPTNKLHCTYAKLDRSGIPAICLAFDSWRFGKK